MQIATLTDSFTRPDNTTAYAANDLVANNATAGSVTPLSWDEINVGKYGPVSISRVRVHKSGTTATDAQFRVHLFTASPTVANGDNGAFSASQSANYLGSTDATLVAFSDGCAQVSAISVPIITDFSGSSRTIYALIEALAAYTPAAEEVFTVSLFIERIAERN